MLWIPLPCHFKVFNANTGLVLLAIYLYGKQGTPPVIFLKVKCYQSHHSLDATCLFTQITLANFKEGKFKVLLTERKPLLKKVISHLCIQKYIKCVPPPHLSNLLPWETEPCPANVGFPFSSFPGLQRQALW